MDSILIGTIIGAAVGTGFGFLSKVNKQRKSEVANLGFDWSYLKLDDHLTQLLFSLKAFSNADIESYKQIGDLCNEMVSLWVLVSSPDTKKQFMWTFKSFKCKGEVVEQLSKMSKSVPLFVSKQTNQKKNEIRLYASEFYSLADQIAEAINNYHHNITIELNSANYVGSEESE